jgi:uncharacterized repeat protein (TIGR03803 family)
MEMCYTPNGMLYGVNNSGGIYDYGTIYKFNPTTNIYTHLLDFNGLNGRYPRSGLFLANNGKLYGSTISGRITDVDVLYEIDPATDTYTKKLDLGMSNPIGSYNKFVQAPNGLYILKVKSNSYSVSKKLVIRH